MTGSDGGVTRLRLDREGEVEAFVHIEPGALDKPKCLLLHGNPRSLLDWQQLVPHLSAAADIAAVDLPGFGNSPPSGPSPEALSLDCLADCTIAAANALGWREPIFLVGHSHGGGVAQAVAARYPERVAGLILIGTLGFPAHTSYRLLALPGATAVARLVGKMLCAAQFRSLSRAILRAVLSDIFFPEPVSTETIDRELALLSSRPHILTSMVHVTLARPCAQLLASAPAIRCPTLFLHGSEDALVPPRYARAIHDRIVLAGGRSRFELVPGAGHMLINYQAPQVAALMLRTLRHHHAS